ncbi:hypothetical protein Spock_143 [Bacillus phage Spock]|uniref:Uncharacterized protein n=2 Tax=Bequatrovirus spock TaxID=1918008 RepID=A0A1X9SG01_9CAUD|nr:hypothetical protein Spock_143 [Bacillus phage Spock]AGY48543.1 hypothetical protein Spock_143 [Bacillus phage Spock]ARQ95055.1 hypothetical protein FLAPJACK_144 [Bacillus phage Flapjack]
MKQNRWELEKEFKRHVAAAIEWSMMDDEYPHIDEVIIQNLADTYNQPIAYARHYILTELEVAIDKYMDSH